MAAPFLACRAGGESPSAYRARDHSAAAAIPACYAKILTGPVRNEEAKQTPPAVP